MSNKWIDVNRGVPNPFEEVLVYGSYKYEIFKRATDGTMTPDGVKEREHFWIAKHSKNGVWDEGNNKKITFWQPLPQPPGSLIGPGKEVKEPEDMTLADVTIDDLESALEYAQRRVKGDQNPELYAKEAAALEIALGIIKNELGNRYDQHHWFWRRDWEET